MHESLRREIVRREKRRDRTSLVANTLLVSLIGAALVAVTCMICNCIEQCDFCWRQWL